MKPKIQMDELKYVLENMPHTYTAELLKALKPPSEHLDEPLHQHLVDLGIFYPRAKVEHKRQMKRERNRQRRKTNKTKLPIITTTNLHSINNKQDELLQYLEDSRTDIACLTETWLNDHSINPEIFNKFNDLSNPRRGKQGGGTLVAIRKDYADNCDEIKASYNQQDGVNSLEVTTVRLRPRRLPRGYSSCIVSSIYVPPSFN